MKRSSAPLAVILALGMSMVFGQSEPAHAGNSYYSSLQENAHADWMGGVPGSAGLAELSIPGTHDTLAVYGGDAVETQEKREHDNGVGGAPLAFQLGAGIRAIDIRVRMVPDEDDNAKFAVHHGAFYQNANFDDVIREARTFLTAHPAETILLNLKGECTGQTGSCDDMDPDEGSADPNVRRRQIFNAYRDANTDLFWMPSATGAVDVPTLDAVRGKLVLVNFSGPFGGNFTDYGFSQLNHDPWPDESNQPNCYVQNAYLVETTFVIDTKWEKVRHHLERTNKEPDCRDSTQPNHDKMHYNWTSGASTGAYPYTVAGGYGGVTGVNNFLYQCLTGVNDRCDTPIIKRTGAVIMDYPGGDLVTEILRRNPAAPVNGGVGDPMEEHPGGDDGGTRPSVPGDHAACRPDGLVATASTATPYCLVYQGDGREWLGEGRSRRVVGYFNGGRTGSDGTPSYLVKNIPWSKVTHINYAFAHVENNQISVGANNAANPATGMEWPGVRGAEMDSTVAYKGHFNLLTKYKKLHPRVKTLISVGGWAESGGFYAMTTNADGSVNQSGINTFADSAVAFLRQYGFNGVDIDFEYPTALDDTGNPDDWAGARSRRKGLPTSYTALMRTLREKLDKAGAADGRYYLLTSASTGSGYLARGMDNQKALRYQDFTNLMAYDFHGTWNDVVGPNAPLYDDGKDPELADLYSTPEYKGIGYFNTDWAMRHMRGAMQAGRVNIGIPYYTRGWKNVTGGTNGMWGSSTRSDCQPGTGIRRPCGDGAVGIDNIWHDKTATGAELGAGSNPMWHAKNLQENILPNYAQKVGLTPDSDPDDRLTGTYTRHWDQATRTSWLWNPTKKTFLSTQDLEGVDAIADYVTSSGAGGVMMWELGGDYACPAQITAATPCGMGYTMTNRLNEKLNGAAAYGNSRSAGSTVQPPTGTLNVKVDLVGYPTDAANMWPMQPTVRLTNDTGVTVGGGKDTVLSFDLPSATSSLVKDVNWQTGEQGGQWKLTAGSTFHRISTTLDYCQIIPPGKTLDLPIKYYLPVTGPANTTLKIGNSTFSPVSENLRGTTPATPPSGGCSAPAWNSGTVYNPAAQTVEATTVKYDGKVWKAKWWTQGNIPGTGADADHEPWKYVGPAS